MPTGYTACIKDGVSFKEFAMGCARAFGACISMRDEPWDAKIPKAFEPSDYHKKGAIAHEHEFKRVERMSDKACQRASQGAYNTRLGQIKTYINQELLLKKKYEKMLEQVRSWKCSESLNEFKKFMDTQIVESIENDCDITYWEKQLETLEAEGPWSGKKWRAKRFKELRWELQYDLKEHEKEVARVAERNKWIRDLRESLGK